MRSFYLTILVSILTISISQAQFQQGTIELSATAIAGSQTESLSGQGFPDRSESSTFAFLNASFGYYFIDGFSLEPQLGLLVLEGSAPSQSVLVNLSYSTRIADSNVALFGRAGYGMGNSFSFPSFGTVPVRVSTKWDVTVVNVGAGIKFLFSEVIAFRAEATYRRESSPSNIPPIDLGGGAVIGRPDVVLANIGIQLGFSVLL